MVAEFHLGEKLRLRKTHPCGGTVWRVERLGADIGIRCLTCSHYLLISRRRLERALKERVPRDASPDTQPAQPHGSEERT